jgi:L-fuconolactonase
VSTPGSPAAAVPASGRVDAHIHHWAPSVKDWYPNLRRPELSAINRDYLPEHYRDDAAGQDIAAVVHVSAAATPRSYLSEARWIDEMAEATGWPAATIATVDPQLPWPEMQADLEVLRGSPRLRGIRVLHGFDPKAPTADDLARWLSDNDLVFDVVSHPHDAAGHRELIERHPDLTVAIEHACWPTAGDDEHFKAWRQAIAGFAERPLTFCKISGLAMTFGTFDIDVQRPWIEACLDAFEPRRSMFASNFPVDRRFGSLAELYDMYGAVAAHFSAAEQKALFGDTARAVYRL